MTPSAAYVPASVPFLPALARAWLDAARAAGRDVADGLLILPTRRAARAAASAFLEANGGPLIMPRIAAIGAADEAALGIEAGLELPPAIPAEERRTILARLILGMGGRDGAPRRLAEALMLADDLAVLIDAAEQAEIDLAATLPGIVAPDLAVHWQRILDFLSIVTRLWPDVLADRGAVDPARRLRLLIDAQAEFWVAAPPVMPVWLAGLAVATPAVARLARVVAGLDAGKVVLAGFDADMKADDWAHLADLPTHPQAGLFRLLTAMGVQRDEVVPLIAADTGARAGRVGLLRQAFLRAAMPDDPASAGLSTDGVLRLDAGDEQDEARAIALALRDALDSPGRVAALVTPDRGLAQLVSAELLRLGIRAEDSAGEVLAGTPPAVLLRLLAAAQDQDYAPVALLAVLKHPLVFAGRDKQACRRLARQVDLWLRVAAPGPGFAALLRALDDEKYREINRFIGSIQILLEPVIAACTPMAIGPAALIGGLIEAAEAIATDETGRCVLWDAEAGAALSEHLAVQLAALEGLAPVDPRELAALLDAVLGTARLRRPRARDANPRVAIWGIMEARLQSVDTLVLGGMVEGVFPAEPDPGPWLSRPMRRAAQLPDDAALIGEAAHDVTSLMASCGTVILSAPRRRGRAPAVPSRFLARLDLVLLGAGLALEAHPAAAWAAQLDQPAVRTVRPKPAPRPAAAARPVEYSISDITTLLADPYAIHARRIMRLRPLDALDAETDAALFGTLVHDGLAAVSGKPDWALNDTAPALLTAAFERELARHRLRRALTAFWRVRLARIAEWIVGIERDRIGESGAADAIAVELPGAWQCGGFTVKGRIDRIERRGTSLQIIDFKTGSPPNDGAVEAGSAPQLPIEAVIAEAGGFAGFAGLVDELAYWKLSGGATEGQTRALLKGDAARVRSVIETARTAIPALLAYYADPATPFFDRPSPARTTFDSPFAGVSRRAEWEDSA
ncbi:MULTISPECIES: double-strand break repair protein AddB [Acidiphilium]|uniref:ATP-dependent helicase/nuclease subunit B n=1 Tax=Acidiphilium rubrum TaxID=526 RepID=A0A8G2FLP8_ACIRU|nr:MULTISPECIES: double-strand break repair protein AddB [Acidiphilium]SIR42555.1 ATP-dependent helicase/nuclease subunit B [Acidiphilium rubrum]